VLKNTFRLVPTEDVWDALAAGTAVVAAIVMAANLPDPGEPEVVPIVGLLGFSIATAFGYARGRRGSLLRFAAFAGAYVGSVAGIALYLAGLLAGT
jgi:hypothetical protein